jgi:GTP diphosphokinase / guanosine-3',5'-bis(diphosphate) 3'-diphosphatase
MDNPQHIPAIEKILKRILGNEQLTGTETIIRCAVGWLTDHWQNEKKPESAFITLEIAEIAAADLHLALEPVLAIILKDIIDRVSYPELCLESSDEKLIREFINGIRKIERLDTTKSATNAENFIKLLLTLSDHIRVILIRIAFQLRSMRNIGNYSEAQQKQIMDESGMIFIPITHRMGFYKIKSEMEDLVLKWKDPATYGEIASKLSSTKKVIDKYSENFIRPIRKRLNENQFDCEIKSRIKSVSSIYRKMQMQKVEFEKVYDLFAIRVILNNTIENEKSDCWKIYSLVTDIYPPNPRRLRDWISRPKSNGYESLHTTVIGPDGKWVEVQIRTRRMDEIAEKSAAAHWKYKSGKQKDETDFFKNLREMLENPGGTAKEPSVSKEKKALYTDEIFIFTPKGDLKKLKAGYTVLDFAWEIHTDVGATCTGGIVNGKMVPLKHVLKNGDTVRILTSRNQKPNRDWLDFVQSPRVIAKIRHALKMETYKESEWGKEIIKNKVSSLGHEFTDPLVNRLIEYFDCENFLDLYQRFGEGKLDPLKIKKALAEKEPEPVQQKAESVPQVISEVFSGKQDYIIIDKNLPSVHYQFAGCCNPIPGNPIFAFVSVTKGIKVHKTTCSNARQLITRYPYRVLEARWKEKK